MFKEAFEFSEGLAPVQTQEGKFGFIDTNGNFAIRPQYAFAESFLNGLAKVRTVKNGWIYEGFIDHQGIYVVQTDKKKIHKEKPGSPKFSI